VVPVLVGFILLIPGFPGDRGPAVHHVFPTAVAGGGDQVEGLGGRAVVEKPFQKILGDINRAAHAARGNPGRDLRLVFWGDQAKGEGEEAGVLGGVVSTFSVLVRLLMSRCTFPGARRVCPEVAGPPLYLPGGMTMRGDLEAIPSAMTALRASIVRSGMSPCLPCANIWAENNRIRQTPLQIADFLITIERIVGGVSFGRRGW